MLESKEEEEAESAEILIQHRSHLVDLCQYVPRTVQRVCVSQRERGGEGASQ
jgi:hypothetical protein